MKLGANILKINSGKNILPKSPNYYSNKKTSQDAHEAIRPVNVDYHPDEIKGYLISRAIQDLFTHLEAFCFFADEPVGFGTNNH